MAINYQKVGWDTTKYFNPTNMNQMDNGIKSACDKADANEAAIADVNSNLSDITKNNDASLLCPYNAITFTTYDGLNYRIGNLYRKIGTRVIIHLSISQASTSGVNSIYTLPSGYRPANESSFIVSDGTATGVASVGIDTKGKIVAYTGSGYIIGEIEFEAYS